MGTVKVVSGPDRRRRAPWLIVAAALALCVTVAAAGAVQESSWRWSGVGRIVAVGDIHGAYGELVSGLQTAGIIDQALAWSGGEDHFVSVGDYTDRGPDSRKVMDLLMRLQGEAEAAGGRVHVLIGNHEVMNLIGDLRYVSREEYAAFAADELPADREAAYRRFRRKGLGADLAKDQAERYFAATFPPGFFGHRAAFSEDGRYGSWILDRPTMIVLNDTAFVHGGLSLETAALGPEAVNEQLLVQIREFLSDQRRLDKSGFLTSFSGYKGQRQQVREAVAAHSVAASDWRPPEALLQTAFRFLQFKDSLSQSDEGPLWYRGSSLNAAVDETDTIALALERIGARRVVVGHTVTDSRRIETRMDGRVVRIDTGMFALLYQGHPSVLVIEDGKLSALYPPDPTPQAPAPEKPAAPDELETDEGIEAFLQTAHVDGMMEIDSGITKPWQLELEQNGTKMRALFKTVDERIKERVRVGGKFELGFTDRYQYEVAAYRLDRLVGLNMVPVTVLRTIGHHEGSVQLWIEGAISEKQRVAGDLGEDPDAIEAQKARMHILDALIYNVDRNEVNYLYTPGNWRLYPIDHSRSFRLRRSIPDELEDLAITVPPDVAERLAALDLETLESVMGDLLSKEQLKAILGRRDAILKKWGG